MVNICYHGPLRLIKILCHKIISHRNHDRCILEGLSWIIYHICFIIFHIYIYIYTSYSYGIMDNFIICHLYIYNTFITHIINIHISQDQDHASTHPQGTNCCNIGGLRAELARGEENFGGWTIGFPRENHGLSRTCDMIHVFFGDVLNGFK